MKWTDLMTLVRDAVKAGRSLPLEVLWKVAGCPEQVTPRNWVQSNPHHTKYITFGSKHTIAESRVVWQYVWALYPFRKEA